MFKAGILAVFALVLSAQAYAGPAVGGGSSSFIIDQLQQQLINARALSEIQEQGNLNRLEEIIAIQASDGTLFEVVPKNFAFANPEEFSNFSEMLTKQDSIHFVSRDVMNEVINSESNFVPLDLNQLPANVQIHVVTPVTE